MPTEAKISPAVQTLVSASLRSLEELELLLCLRSVGRPQTAAELSQALRIPESLTVAALENLVLNHLIVPQGDGAQLHYRFAPQRPELKQPVEELARTYDEHRFEIIMLISSDAIVRLRSGVLRIFSDSLRSPTRKKGD